LSFLLFYFFFSSRRRHTRWPRDWSSDVCSSDLLGDDFIPWLAKVDRQLGVVGVVLVPLGEPGDEVVPEHVVVEEALGSGLRPAKIGRASCRERVESEGRGRVLCANWVGRCWSGE